LRRGGYLVDFWGAGFDVAERMDIVPELRRRGYVLTEVRAVDRDGRRVASLKPPRSWARRSGTSASPGPIWLMSSTTRSTATLS
jgi:hypothetical protein